MQVARLYEHLDAKAQVAVLREALEGFEASEDVRWAPLVQAARTELLIAEGRIAEALPEAKTNFAGAKKTGARTYITDAGSLLALLFCARGEYEPARSTLDETLAGEKDVGRLASLHTLLAAVSADQGAIDDAERSVTNIGPEWRRLRSPRSVAHLLEAVGKIAAGRGRPGDAARMLGAAESYRRRVGVQRDTHELAAFARALDAARSALGEDEFSAAFDGGGALAFDEALTEALG